MCTLGFSTSVLFFFFYIFAILRDLHSFPTRRSSDLLFLSLILHLGNLFLIVQLHFSKLFLILKCNWTIRKRLPRDRKSGSSRNAETDLVCRLLLEKKKETYT